MPLRQQDFLREAMEALGMNEDQFAERLSVTPHQFNKWLLPGDSPGYAEMSESTWDLIREMQRRPV
jgi:DNA-binding transcriptional regulator YiaG